MARCVHAQRGQVMETFIVFFAVVAITTAFVVDLTPAFTCKIEQRGVLDEVSEELGMPSSMILDSQTGTDPGDAVARRAIAAARGDGFDGTVIVWFYEPAEGELIAGAHKVDANDRLWAWEVELSDRRPNLMSGFTGTDGIDVSSGCSGTANPYARARVHRNTSSPIAEIRKYTSNPGEESYSKAESVASYSELPQGLKSSFEQAYAALRTD